MTPSRMKPGTLQVAADTTTTQQKIRAYDITTGLNQAHNTSVCAGGERGIIQSHGVCRQIFGPQVLQINKVLVGGG
jgi:hypothetical protein